MAEIPIQNEVVNVQIGTTPQTPSRQGFGVGLIVTTAAENAAATTPIPLSEGVRLYGSIDEVLIDWVVTTEVYKMALVWFSPNPRPTQIAVGAVDAGDADEVSTIARLKEKSNDWYAFFWEKTTRDTADIVLLAAWTEANTRLFFTASNDANSIESGDATDVLFDLNAAGYRRTFLIYDDDADEYPDVAAFARMATVNFAEKDSTITLKFKAFPGITPVSITSGQLANLKAKGGNAYVTVGGIDMLTEGIMVKGVGTWADTVHGVDWLQNAIETNIFTLLVVQPKVPLTDKGAQSIAGEISNGIDEGVNNGLIAPGEASNGDFLQKGYEVVVGLVADMPLSDRQERKAPPMTFRAIGASAIHFVSVTGTFEG